ncbi:hypothetical protein [Geobacter grbiciae]|uniref:hypothetical protein n=1 Tax=Geobacter grbiciae TaxID=155042 RepID=UPI001C0355C5|nr:hypothetical protein [Geobacter grbiciae]MBT1075654.1 hypothetical protein [Geobacter grbiciae]
MNFVEDGVAEAVNSGRRMEKVGDGEGESEGEKSGAVPGKPLPFRQGAGSS